MIMRLLIRVLDKINERLFLWYEKLLPYFPDEDLNEEKVNLVNEYNQGSPLFRENKLRLIQLTCKELEARKTEDNQKG